jgi:hypothetical protein
MNLEVQLGRERRRNNRDLQQLKLLQVVLRAEHQHRALDWYSFERRESRSSKI